MYERPWWESRERQCPITAPDYDNNIPPAAFSGLFWLTFLLLLTGVSTEEDGGINVSWMAGGVNFNILSGQILWRKKYKNRIAKIIIKSTIYLQWQELLGIILFHGYWVGLAKLLELLTVGLVSLT